MHLIFETSHSALAYGVYTVDGALVYEGRSTVTDWSPRAIQSLFQSDILAHVRAHGKIFTKIGLVFPFADPTHSKPELAHARFIKSQMRTPLLKAYFQPVEQLLSLTQKTWPHLPHFFLFDTCLSEQLERHAVLPHLSHTGAKELRVLPRVLASYYHKATKLIKFHRPYVSLVLGDATSLALIDDDTFIDALPAFSPFPSTLGLYYGGMSDLGVVTELTDTYRSDRLVSFVDKNMGLFGMVGQDFDFETLLHVSGLVPRSQNTSLPDLPIETIEWIELCMRAYSKSVRGAIAQLVSGDVEARTIIVSSPIIAESSSFWPLLLAGSLSHFKLIYNPHSPLHSAALDLAAL